MITLTDGKQVILGKFERMALLSDFYGDLLTERQQEVIRFYYEQDLSLGEIAEHLNITRQAVHDILKRAERALEHYEEKLRLLDSFLKEKGASDPQEGR
ncbi:MAG: YlxM family DNA-binding protein [Thermacetogeniaceae bacterium]